HNVGKRATAGCGGEVDEAMGVEGIARLGLPPVEFEVTAAARRAMSTCEASACAGVAPYLWATISTSDWVEMVGALGS
ncbi:hypothetical protein, partial [Bacteroides thetaiotaomicron]|uniref:hypothetical protein n=1 Tax=Bacteroides thetaiotaomicron TaxID=818 RepID=UPI001A923862